MVNRYFRREPYDLGLYTPPVGVMEQMLQLAQRQYDTNYNLGETIKQNFIQSMPQDRARANTIQQGWNQQVDDIVSSYGGDYSQATKKLNALLSNIKKSYAPGGEANAITSNYTSYNTWLEQQRERLNKKEILAEDLNRANNYYMNTYQGIGNIDPVTGDFNRLNPEHIVEYKDYNATINEINKNIPIEKQAIGRTVRNGSYLDYQYQNVEGKDPNKLYSAFRTGLENDPQIVSRMSQISKFLGLPEDAANLWLDQISQAKAQELGGYSTTERTNKLEADPFALASHKAALDRANIKYKNELDKKTIQDLQSGLEYGQLTGNPYAKSEPNIDPEHWKDERSIIKTGLAKGIPAGLFGIPGHIAGQILSSDGENFLKDNLGISLRKSNTSTGELNSYLNNKTNDPKLVNKNVIPDLARAMWEKKKNDFKSEYDSKYGKDAQWTKEFEKNFWYDYKKEYKNNSSFNTYSFNIPLQAKKNALQYIPNVLAGDAAFYLPGKYGQTTELPSSIKESLINKSTGKINYDALDVNYVIPHAGHEAAGFQISTPKGSFVIVDPNVQRAQLSNRLGLALNPIFQEGKSEGYASIPFIYEGKDANGNNITYDGIPIAKWEYNPDTKKWDQNFYMKTSQGMTPHPVSLPQILDANIPFFNEALGFGQTKASISPFEYFLQDQ